MSSPSNLHFPDAATITQYLSNHPSFKVDYCKEKGITKAIAELAAARFADREVSTVEVDVGATTMLIDLLRGKDGFSGEALPNLGELGLPSISWAQIDLATRAALIDCANSSKV
jgi:hypothetical protein